MRISDSDSFIDLCKNYRIAVYIFTSVLYIIVEDFYAQIAIQNFLIIIGMGIACFLGNYMYDALEEQVVLTKIILVFELFAYGVFVYTSGGFSSTYLWYYICCLLVVMNRKEDFSFIFFGSAWCLFCAWSGISDFDTILRLKLNIVAGVGMTLGSFFILKINFDKIRGQREELSQLYKKISYENERSEYALLQLSNIYETFDILAMKDPEKIVSLLSDILKKTIATKGLILMKLDVEGTIVEVSSSDIESDKVSYFVQYISAYCLDSRKFEKIVKRIDSEIYEIIPIGDEVSICGIIVKKKIEEEYTEKEKFYLRLIEIIFKNMDMHDHMEKYISSEEKNRIADEIHDTTIQKLFGISCSLKSLELNLESLENDVIKSTINELNKSTQLTMTELRETIYGNRFEDESEEFFRKRISLYISEVSKLNSVNINFKMDDDIDLLQSSKKIVIYRVVCEAINNAVRHGNAHNINVYISCEDKKVKVNIVDDGCGFKNKKEKVGGNGLRNMKRMANLIKGSLLIETTKSGGIAVRLTLPQE